MEVIIITTVFQDTCTHGAYLPIEDTRMGCFGEKNKKRKYSSRVRYGTVHIDVFSSFVYIEREKRKGSVGGRDIFFVLSPWISFSFA